MRRGALATIGAAVVAVGLLAGGPASAATAATAAPADAHTATGATEASPGTGTGTLTVMLMTPQKTRIERADVEVTLDDQAGTQLQAETDASGEATFTDVHAGDRWVVRSYDWYPDGWDTRLPGTRWDVPVTAGAHSWVVSVARIGAVLHGGVTAADGAPVNLAEVILVDEWNHKTYRTWTDADGRYDIIDLPTTDVSVTVEKSGFVSCTPFTTEVHAEYGDSPATVGTHDVVLQPAG